MNQFFQEITVGVILLAVAVIIFIKILNFFHNKNKTTFHDCDNCAGCDLKGIVKNKQQECDKFHTIS
jgi:hypothetical protein